MSQQVLTRGVDKCSICSISANGGACCASTLLFWGMCLVS